MILSNARSAPLRQTVSIIDGDLAMQPIRSIVHPTDFSDASAEAFAHALRIALIAKCRLYVLHVSVPADETDWLSFPHVRETLARWGLLSTMEVPAAVAERLGVEISKVTLEPQAVLPGVQTFLDEHAADLIVLATEGRQGVARWLHGSVAERVARYARAPTLFVPAGRPGIVDQTRGELRLRRVLIPIDHAPKPAAAIGSILGFAHALAGLGVEERLLHVGREAPQVQRHAEPGQLMPVALRHGDVVEAIVKEATEWQADLIGMPTAGHDGFLDALRGSTTERVLRQAPCPLLAVPTDLT